MRRNTKILASLTSSALLTLGCLALPGLAAADDNAQSKGRPAQVRVSNTDQAHKTADHSARAMDLVQKPAPDAHPGHPGGHHAPPPPHHGHHAPPPRPRFHHEPHDSSRVVVTSDSYYSTTSYSSSNDDLVVPLLGVISGGVFMITGAAMGIVAITGDEVEFGDDDWSPGSMDHQERVAVGVSGGVLLGLGALLTGFGGYFLHRALSDDYAFNVTPTVGPEFNGAVFNMTF